MSNMKASLGQHSASNLPNSVKINENPAAEREADRISSGIPSYLTPDQLKSALSQRMDADFSGVRFHTGAQAEQSATSIGARAYAQGKDVYFGKGGFDSQIAAHELVHTVQQGSVSGEGTMSTPTGQIQMWPWSKKKKQENAPVQSPANSAASDPQASAAQAPASPAAPKKSFIEKAKGKAASAKAWLKEKGANAKKGMGNALSAIGNYSKNRVIDTFDSIRNAQDDFHDWRKGVKKKIKNAYEGSSLQNGVNAVKGAFGKAGSWVKDKASSAANYVKNSAFGKAVGSAATTVKDKAKDAGVWVKDKAVKAGGWIKDKASSAANYVKDSAFGKAVGSAATTVKDKASSAANYVKNSSFGKAVGSAAHKVKGGAINLANKVGEKYGSAKKWVGEKTDNVKHWIQDKKAAIKDHDDKRYLFHQASKDKTYAMRMMAALNVMKQGQIGENVAHRSDVEHLGRYDEENRTYDPTAAAESGIRQLCTTLASGNHEQNAEPVGAQMTDEGKKGWGNAVEDLFGGSGSIADFLDDSIDDYNKVKMGIGLAKPKFNEDGEFDFGEFDLEDHGKIGKGISDGMNGVKTAVSARNIIKNIAGGIKSAKAGNMMNMAMSLGDTVNEGMSIAGNFTDSLPFNFVNDSVDLLRNGMNFGIHSKQKHDVNKLTKEDLGKGITNDHNKRMIANAQNSISGKLSRDQVNDVSEMIQSGFKLGGRIADVSGAGGVGTAVAKLINVPVNLITKGATSKMKQKNNKKIVQNDLFGNHDIYHSVKETHGLNRKSMDLLMQMATNMGSMDEIANMAKTDQAIALHQTLGGDGDTGADALMSGVGYKTKAGRQSLGLDDIKEVLDVDGDIDPEEVQRRRDARKRH